jgi:hypothetical protein
MATHTLFEVLTLKGSQWQVDSTYQQREEAIEMARSLFGEKIYQGVKVIQDKYDPTTGDTREAVIYDSNKQVKPRAAPTTERDAPKAASPRPTTAQKPGKPARSKDVAVAVKASLLLLVILVGGLGSLYGLDYISAWFSSIF